MHENELIYNETYCVKGSPLYRIEVLEIENADLRRIIQAERDANASMQILIDELREVLKEVEWIGSDEQPRTLLDKAGVNRVEMKRK